MLDVSVMYGPHGPDTTGDSHVADILRRTVEGQPAATSAFDSRASSLLSLKTLPLDDLPVMTVTHAEWLAAMYWQMASCFLDSTVPAFAGTSDVFRALAYTDSDILCDSATDWSRKAVQIRATITNSGKVRIAKATALPQFSLTPQTHYGVWAVYDFVTWRVSDDSELLAIDTRIPQRFRSLYRDMSRQVRIHTEVMSELRRSFLATSIPENAEQILHEAKNHVEELFTFGQQLWAPYLLGTSYTEAQRRQLSLDELELGFDPWILTDPKRRKIEEHNPESRKALAEFWSSVTDIPALHQLALQVIELRRSDSLRRRSGRDYSIVPWSSQFLVRRPVTLCDRAFEPGDLIAFFTRPQDSQVMVDIRKTGKLTKPLDLLGHQLAEHKTASS